MPVVMCLACSMRPSVQPRCWVVDISSGGLFLKRGGPVLFPFLAPLEMSAVGLFWFL